MGRRVALRPAGPDVPAAAGWPKGLPAGDLVAIRHGAEAIGFIALAVAGRAVRYNALWLAPHARRAGYGVEAIATLCEALKRAGAETVTAAVPAEHGLLVYFWLRLGFRPVPGSVTSAGALFERRLADRTR